MELVGTGRAIKEETQRYLSQMTLFHDLEPCALAEVTSLVTLRSYRPDKTFFVPQQRIATLFFLFEGSVHLYLLSQCGRKLVFTALGPGSLFGERTLLGAGERRMYAQAFTACTVGLMEPDAFGRLMLKHPQVATRFLQLLGLRLMKMERALVEISFKPVAARLAGLLLRSADENGCNQEVRGFTHRDYADMLGTYRETVTEALGGFKAQGLITVGRRHITLLDRQGLEHLANR